MQSPTNTNTTCQKRYRVLNPIHCNYNIPYFLTSCHVFKCFSYLIKWIFSVYNRPEASFFNQIFDKIQPILYVFRTIENDSLPAKQFCNGYKEQVQQPV